MKVLVVGGGGREHALAWKAAQSPGIARVFVAPGNAGTAAEAKCENVTIEASDVPALLSFARREKIDLTIVGPEAPLAAGIVDEFTATGLACFGPTRNAAQLEGSKSFSKAFCERHGIPSAAYRAFTDIEPARIYVRKASFPLVIKADGLAAGKGVVIAQTQEEAERTIEGMLSGESFGSAGREVVIEEFLEGEEVELHCPRRRRTIPRTRKLAGSQTHRRRRHRPQYRRHGRIFARVHRQRRIKRTHRTRSDPARVGGHDGRRYATIPAFFMRG